MRTIKHALLRSVTVIAASTLLWGCATKVSGQEASSTATASGAKEILFWHSMGGTNQEKLQKIVDGFNASQSEYVIVAENQGKYDESTSKYFNMSGGAGSPAMIQIGEQNLQSMIDSGLIASVSEQIEAYGYDKSQLLPQVVNFYSVNDTLYAMPFNASTPILYYNADALKAAGITQVPTTFEGILDAAPQIMEANSGMKAVGMHAYGYALDQMVVNMGGLIVNNENGRKARTTEVAYQDQMQQIFTWVADLMEKNALINYGSSNDNVMSGFNQKEFAMFISTSAVAANVIENAGFEVGISPLPTPAQIQPQGVYAGGGAICISKGLDEQTAKGTMAFLTYATSSEVQASWAGDTGYFPINIQSYDTQTMKDIYAAKPQLRVAADQLLNSKETASTAGPLLSQLPQLRTDLQSALEMVFNGYDPAQAIAQAADNTNKQIEIANKSVNN